LAFSGVFVRLLPSSTVEGAKSASQAPKAMYTGAPVIRAIVQPKPPSVSTAIETQTKPAPVAPNLPAGDGISAIRKSRAPSAPPQPATPSTLPVHVDKEAKAAVKPTAPETPAPSPEVVPKVRPQKPVERLVNPFDTAIPTPAPKELRRRSDLENL